MGNKGRLLVGVLIVLLFIIESVVAHAFWTAHFPGGNDFYSRWAGARALLLEGRDPYSLEVTAEIQTVIGVDPAQIGRGGFAYPFYVVFLFWPLVYFSYDWAQAIWMVTLQWVAVAAVAGLLGLERWRLSPVGLVGVLLATLFLYPVARTIFLGQFTLHVALFLVAALLALRRGRDGWAGVWLAATFIKPQVVIFVALWLILWAIRQRRWGLLKGLLIGGVLLSLAALVLFPRWPISMLEDVVRYSKVAGGRSPLMVLVGLLWRGRSEVVHYGLVGLLLLMVLAVWWRDWRGDETDFLRGTYWAIVTSLLVLFQTGTTNQVILLIPLFAWLHKALDRWSRWQVTIGVIGLLVALWVLFLSTIQGNWENPIMFLPLPLFCLAVLIGTEVHHWRVARQLVE